ncbi:MAG: PatB family C-S lyase [Candidatus Cryosericum sp.]|nr:PatB family C-S lyase [bacterium]
MNYDLDHGLDRHNTGCVKWDQIYTIFGSDDVLPMWIADMDFPVPKPVTEALIKRAQHEAYGYSFAAPSVLDAIIERLWRVYDWKVDPAWILFTPGVVPALHAAVRAFTTPGDAVVLQSPVYYPFWSAIRENGCQVANNQLLWNGTRYVMDLEGLKSVFLPHASGMSASPSRVRMIILCSPHNPVGRVWTRDELAAVGEIALANDAIVVSDEIHCELMLNGSRHTPFASLSPELEQNTIVCMAPSKTFNLAGLATSFIIIPNPRLRAAMQRRITGAVGSVTPFGYTALEASFREGDEWLTQVLHYIEGNVTYAQLFVQDHIPQVKVMPIEGTYLLWLDFRALGMDVHELSRFLREKARIGLDDGYVFGPGGEGFARMNIACPRSTLQEGLTRLADAIRSLEQH